MRPLPRVHAITDTQVLALSDFGARAAAIAAAGPAVALHARDRSAGGAALAAATSRLAALARPPEAMVLVNGRPDVAAACGAGGVQLAASDLAPADARRICGGFIGRSVHSEDEARAAADEGADFVIASPSGYGLEGARQVVDPLEAADGADIIYTDVWVSMGGEDSDERRAAFEPYQVDEAMMARGNDAWFLHCLPARRGEEVTAPVIDGRRSGVWRQAENRMHTARGAMLWMLGQA